MNQKMRLLIFGKGLSGRCLFIVVSKGGCHEP